MENKKMSPAETVQMEQWAQTLEEYKGLNVVRDENIPTPGEIESRETIVLPEIQSMREYICHHCEKEIVARVSEDIINGFLTVRDGDQWYHTTAWEEQPPISGAFPEWNFDETPEIPMNLEDIEVTDVDCKQITADLRPKKGRICWIDFWRTDECSVQADLYIDMDVEINDDGKTQTVRQRYRADMYLNMDDDIFIKYGHIRDDYGEEYKEGFKLDDYLVPILSWDDLEYEAEDMIRRLAPRGLEDPKYLEPTLFAEKLGLKIVKLPLYKRERTASILFFRAGEVEIGVENDEGEIVPGSEHVDANTIVLNSSMISDKKAIFHECFHYVEHRMFYQLQKMYNNDIAKLAQWKPVKLARNKRSPLEWIEWQAQVGSECLMMPRTLVRRHIKARLKAMEKDGRHMGYKLQSVGKLLAKDFGVYNYQMRNRMIHVGYREARGSLNYVDKGYIVPFTFDMNECRRSQTFVITPKEMIEEYVRNEKFRAIIDTGRYIYVDGHICVNDEKYVCKSGENLLLTRWANAHVDACCLRFVRNYNRNPQTHYICGQLNSDEEYNGRSLAYCVEHEPSATMARAKEISEVMLSLPNGYSGTIKAHMQRLGIKGEAKNAISGISESTLKRALKEDENHSLKMTIAICVGLHLEPEYSMDLIEKSGKRLLYTPEHLIYKAILQTMYTKSIWEVQEMIETITKKKIKLLDE